MISRNSSYNIIKRRAAGQTLIIAIMVMFVVALVAAVFIGLVARNLFRSGRYSNVDVVSQLAEAGVRYADKMLTSSEEGADWRPVPDNVTLVPPAKLPSIPPDTTGLNPNWETMRDKNPDFRWTRPYWPTELPAGAGPGMGYAGPTGGYTTFNSGQGRFLIRISYKPNMADPVSKYIKIESIGRFGVYDNNDPTTDKPNGDSNLRREITAYKPIGVTDYLRFITNKDNRNTRFPLGCPGYDLKYGRPKGKFGMRGAPMRINGNVMWYGSGGSAMQLYLRATNASGSTPLDRVEVAGEVFKDTDDVGVSISRMDLAGNVLGTSGVKVSSDNSGSYSWTIGGFIRDNYPTASEPTRRIKRIEPPLVDQPGPTNTTTRYRLLTLNSGERVNVNGSWVNLGQLGWGRGIYIGNFNDKQADSETLAGGYTLRADWLQPNNPMSSYWKGSYYIPPGAVIVLHPGDTDGDKIPDLSITRSDYGFTTWYDAWGNPRPDWGRTVTMPYPDAKNGRTATRNVNGVEQKKEIDGNGVIYAEGNIRIRGMLPKGVQLTVVSGQNIYIEGNLLKNRELDWTNTTTGSDYGYRGADPTGGLALLAEQSVCVNTTQFFAPQDGLDRLGSNAHNGQPPYHMVLTGEPDSKAEFGFDMGPWESENADAPTKWYMVLRHAGQYGASYINAWLNPGDVDSINNGLLRLNTAWRAGLPGPGLQEWVWGAGDPNFNASGWGIDDVFAGEVFPLTSGAGMMNANLIQAIGEPNMLRIALDQTTFTRNNYELSAFAIQPADIRIEAAIYAQEGSFFVLPGNWFNLEESDTPPTADEIANGKIRPQGVNPQFPYYGQPLDIRIIVDGAISENTPAAIGDVQEWMAKWGKIPSVYGSSNIATAHPGEGLTLLYDDHMGWPLTDPANPASQPIRTDDYGRALPIAPRLPVSGSLIYFGDGM